MHRAIGEAPGHGGVGLHFGQLVLDRLQLAHSATEGLSLLDVLASELIGGLHGGGGLDADHETLAGELTHQHAEAAVDAGLAAQDRAGRDADIVEEQLGSVLT